MLSAPNQPVFTFLRPEQSHFLFLHLSISGSSTQGRNKKKKQVMVLKNKRAGATLCSGSCPLTEIWAPSPRPWLRSLECQSQGNDPWRTPALSSSLLPDWDTPRMTLELDQGRKESHLGQQNFTQGEDVVREKAKPRWESERPQMLLLESDQGKKRKQYFLGRF